ncbi:MAG: hypothetical protein QM674_00290 [Burkholderiaceae bacterium]
MEMQSKPATAEGQPSFAWGEWVSLMGYAGIVAVTVACALGVAVVLLGT